MINVNLYKLLNEDCKVRHKGGRSSKLVVTLNGHDYICNNQDEVAEKIKGNYNLFTNNINWNKYIEETKQNLKDINQLYSVQLPNDISETLKEILTNKTKFIAKIDSITGSPSDTRCTPINAEPKVNLNQIDYKILSGIKYCVTDKSIYFKRDNTLRLIGPLKAVEKDPTMNSLCAEIAKNIARNFNNDVKYTLKEFITDNTNALADKKKILVREIQNEIDRGVKWEDIKIKYEDEYFIPNNYSAQDKTKAADSAAESYIFDSYWEKVPASIFSSKVICIKNKIEEYEYLDPNGTKREEFIWRGFYVGTTKIDDVISEERYLKNFFTHFKAELMDDEFFRIEDVPRTYTDTDEFESLFKFDNERLIKAWPKGYYTDINDCENIKLLKSWMNEDEYRLAMAWAYAVIHPTSINSNIALLLWTGGGTGKSSFVAMIKEALLMASNAKPSDIYFEIKGTKFDEDQKYWIPDGQAGVPYAALINVDEATTKTIELYKDFSGSASGNKLSFRRLYEDSAVVDIFGKFIFTTNKGLQLTSDDGSLKRRIAIIKHKEIKNVIGCANKSNDEIQLEFKKQVFMLLKEGKKAVNEIKEMGYESIDKYASEHENISKNLKESTASTVNEMIYKETYNKVMQLYSDLGIPYENCIRIQAGTLKFIYKIVADEQGEEAKYFGSLKNWMTENTSFFTHPNIRRQMRNFIKLKNGNMATSMMVGNFEFCDKSSDCIFELYPLKNNNIEIAETAEDYIEDDKTEEIDPHFPQALECDTIFEEYNPIEINNL